jgi:hypothetical protein
MVHSSLPVVNACMMSSLIDDVTLVGFVDCFAFTHSRFDL